MRELSTLRYLASRSIRPISTTGDIVELELKGPQNLVMSSNLDYYQRVYSVEVSSSGFVMCLSKMKGLYLGISKTSMGK